MERFTSCTSDLEYELRAEAAAAAAASDAASASEPEPSESTHGSLDGSQLGDGLPESADDDVARGLSKTRLAAGGVADAAVADAAVAGAEETLQKRARKKSRKFDEACEALAERSSYSRAERGPRARARLSAETAARVPRPCTPDESATSPPPREEPPARGATYSSPVRGAEKTTPPSIPLGFTASIDVGEQPTRRSRSGRPMKPKLPYLSAMEPPLLKWEKERRQKEQRGASGRGADAAADEGGRRAKARRVSRESSADAPDEESDELFGPPELFDTSDLVDTELLGDGGSAIVA